MKWLDIKNWEGLYEISNTGLVRNKITNKLITGDKNSSGYQRVCLYNKNHVPQKQRFFRHILVAKHFISNPNNLPEVNHKNSDKDINEDWNLEWCSRKDNERHCIKHGSKQNRYKPFEVKFNNGTVKQYESKSDLSSELNVTPQCIKQWLHKKTKGYLKHGVLQIHYIGNQSIKV